MALVSVGFWLLCWIWVSLDRVEVLVCWIGLAAPHLVHFHQALAFAILDERIDSHRVLVFLPP